MVKEVFAGNPDTKNIQFQHQLVESLTAGRKFNTSLSELIKNEVIKAELVPFQAWLGKVLQLYTMTQMKHGKFGNSVHLDI